MCDVLLFVLPGDDPMIISHSDLDRLGVNYQTAYKVVEILDSKYQEPVEMRNGLPFLMFSSISFFTTR